MTIRSELGSQAEQLVARYLEKKGFVIVALNYKKKFGEIDLIARQGKLLAFVEVKMRSSHYFDLAQVVTPAKQRRICNVAQEYLASVEYDDAGECRFDVALVELVEGLPQINYVPNAFGQEC